MPLYTYKTTAGDTITEFFHAGERPETVTMPDGEIAYYDFVATMKPSAANESRKHGSWPMKSDAAGIHTSQIDEMVKYGARRGVDLKYDRKTGQAIYDSQRHQDQCLKVLGMKNKSHYR